jgi:hypothetical protein
VLYCVLCADAWAGFKKIGEKLLNFSGKTKKQVRRAAVAPNVVTPPLLWCCLCAAFVLLKHVEASIMQLLERRASTTCLVYTAASV